MQKSVGRVEWVGTSVGVTDGLGGVKEQVIVRTPPSQVLHLLPTVSHCGVGGERGFRMRVEETWSESSVSGRTSPVFTLSRASRGPDVSHPWRSLVVALCRLHKD